MYQLCPRANKAINGQWNWIILNDIIYRVNIFGVNSLAFFVIHSWIHYATIYVVETLDALYYIDNLQSTNIVICSM